MTKRFSTPDISDKYSDSLAINIQFRSFGKKEYFCGQVKTAQCPEDNSKVKEILSQPIEIGGILVEEGSWIYADESGVLVSKVKLGDS